MMIIIVYNDNNGNNNNNMHDDNDNDNNNDDMYINIECIVYIIHYRFYMGLKYVMMKLWCYYFQCWNLVDPNDDSNMRSY